MATGRTKHKWWRVYENGYDISGYSRTIGPLGVTYDEADLTAHMSDTVKGYLPNGAQTSAGTLNAVFDNTATVGLHALMAAAGVIKTLLVPIGIRAAPAAGDPCFGGQFLDGAYQLSDDGGAVTVNVPFNGWAGDATSLLYNNPFGILLHENVARTEAVGVNVSDGFDNPTGGATTKGGFFLYQVFAGDGTATLSVDDGTSAINADMDPLAGATTGVINCAVPSAGIIIPTTQTIRQFVRWQIDFNAGGGTATTVTFASAFFRRYQY